MSDPRLVLTATRGLLRYLGLVVTVVLLAAASCGPTSPTGSTPSTVLTSPAASPIPSPGETYNRLSAQSGQGGDPDYSNLSNLPVEFSGQGFLTSKQFQVNTGTVTVDYTYDCSAAGSVNFFADIVSDNHPPGVWPIPHEDPYPQITNAIVNASGAAGWTSTTVHLHQASDEYFLLVGTSDPSRPGCNWRIIVKNG